MIYAVDFDGTLCESRFPEIGEPNIELIDFLKAERLAGHKVILYTMREGGILREAVRWCNQFGLFFDCVNENLPERVREYNNNPRKIYADVYIDDHNAQYGVCTALPYMGV